MSDFHRISMEKARKLFYKGKPVFITTSKRRWYDTMTPPLEITLDPEEENDRKELHEKFPTSLGVPRVYISQFESIINSFSYYNCDKVQGKRVIFLVDKSKYNSKE